MLQNHNTLNLTKLKHSKCDKSQKLQKWQKSLCDKTQKLKILQPKNSKRDNTQTLKMCQNWKLEMWQNSCEEQLDTSTT